MSTGKSRRIILRCTLIWCFLLSGCSGSARNDTGRVHQTIFDPPSTLLVRAGYDYAPAVIRDGDIEHYWWCGVGRAPGTRRDADVIYYRARDVATESWIAPTRMVLWPTVGDWDQVHVCDPAVVRGRFVNPDDGAVYTYALYYTATEDAPGHNDIGVAFSNDGIIWVKYSKNPVILPQVPGTGTYGAGQPAVVNYDKQSGIHMFHTDTSVAGNRIYVRRSSDGISFGAPIQIPMLEGVRSMANSDFAYDASTHSYIGALGLPGRPGDRDTHHFGLYTIPASDLLEGKGTWIELGIVNTDLTGWYLNHSPGIRRDRYGMIERWLPKVRIVFGAGENHPYTWDLRQIETDLSAR